MLMRPQPYQAEAKTHKAEARFIGLKVEAEFEAKFMRWQRFENRKICNGSLLYCYWTFVMVIALLLWLLNFCYGYWTFVMVIKLVL